MRRLIWLGGSLAAGFLLGQIFPSDTKPVVGMSKAIFPRADHGLQNAAGEADFSGPVLRGLDPRGITRLSDSEKFENLPLERQLKAMSRMSEVVRTGAPRQLLILKRSLGRLSVEQLNSLREHVRKQGETAVHEDSVESQISEVLAGKDPKQALQWGKKSSDAVLVRAALREIKSTDYAGAIRAFFEVRAQNASFSGLSDALNLAPGERPVGDLEEARRVFVENIRLLNLREITQLLTVWVSLEGARTGSAVGVLNTMRAQMSELASQKKDAPYTPQQWQQQQLQSVLPALQRYFGDDLDSTFVSALNAQERDAFDFSREAERRMRQEGIHKAVEWMQGENGMSLAKAFSQIWGPWLAESPEAARSWLESVPPGENRDRIFDGLFSLAMRPGGQDPGRTDVEALFADPGNGGKLIEHAAGLSEGLRAAFFAYVQNRYPTGVLPPVDQLNLPPALAEEFRKKTAAVPPEAP
jgi:hypothetical protein